MSVRRADPNGYTLGENLSASGSPVSIQGGLYMLFVEGTAGGSVLSLQIATPHGTYVDVQSLGGLVVVKSATLPYTASPIDLPRGNVKIAATGGSPSEIYAYLIGLD